MEVCESRVLLSATSATSATAGTDGTNVSSVIEYDYAAMLSTYNTAVDTASGSLADQTATSYMGSLPDAGFGLDDFSGTAATDGTELGPIVGPYSGQIDGAAAGFAETAMSTWQGTQQQTTDPQSATVASQGVGDVPSTSGNSGAADPWVSAFFGDGQTSATNSSGIASDAPEQQSGNGDDADSETADGDDNLPEPTVSGGFTTTTTVDGDASTTTYTLTSSISLESGSMAGGDQNDDSRWQVPAEWTDKAGTIPKDSDESASEDSDADVTSVDEMDTAPTKESGVRFKASTTITVSVTTSPLTTPDGSAGTTTSVTFTSTGSIVIMVSGSWSAGDGGNTGTVLTEADIAASQSSSGPQAPPSEAESSMKRAPRPIALGGNGKSVSASGEYFSYAFATMTFSVTISNTTMDNDAPGGGLSVPSASLNLSLGSGSFSTDQSDITVQESSESDTSNNAKSVQVKEKNISGSATNFTLNLGGDDDDASDEDAASSDAASPSQSPAVLRDNDWTGGITAPDNSADAAADDGGPVSFSTVSHNSHQKTTLYATQSGQQSATSESSSSTKADIEDSSSGSTSLSFSSRGLDYETTSKSKSEFSYLSESNGSSDSPVGYDGRPSVHSESVSSHVIETLDESGRTFGFGLGSDGLAITNEYWSNDIVSDISKTEMSYGTWIEVFPIITSGDSNELPPPIWVQGPELSTGQIYDTQYNYGGSLEDGFEGQLTDTFHYWADALENGVAVRYGEPATTTKIYPKANDGSAESNQQSCTNTGSGSQMTAYYEGGTEFGDDIAVGSHQDPVKEGFASQTTTPHSNESGDPQPRDPAKMTDEEKFAYYQSLLQVMLLVGQELHGNGMANLDQRFPWLAGNYSTTAGRGGLTGLDGESVLKALKNGNVKAVFPSDWMLLEKAIRYSQQNYGQFNDWWLVDYSSTNLHGFWFIPPLGLTPWILLDRSVFNASPEQAIEAMIHEPLHDFANHGFDHDKLMGRIVTLDHEGYPAPSVYGSAFEQYIDFLKHTKDENGVSLWEKLKDWATKR